MYSRLTVPMLSSEFSSLLLLDNSLLLLDTAHGAGRRRRAHLLELVLLLGAWAVDLLIVLDDLRVSGFELGLQGAVTGGRAEAVSAATWIGRVVGVVLQLRYALAAPKIDASALRNV